MALCGWCLQLGGDHAGHRAAGSGWTCDCERCAMSTEQYLNTTAFRYTCEECGETKTDLGETAAQVAGVRHRLEKHMTSIISRAWEQLDGEVEQIRALQGALDTDDYDTVAAKEADQKALLRAQMAARGKAEILALLMEPVLPDANAVAAEAGERWKARQAGETRVTPGDGTLLAFESPKFKDAIATLQTAEPTSREWTEALFVVTGGVSR